MADRGHNPVRTCLACNGKRPKGELLRLALDSEHSMVVLDQDRRLPGRGAYVCSGCLARLRYNKRVQKAFRNRCRGLAMNPDRQPSF